MFLNKKSEEFGDGFMRADSCIRGAKTSEAVGKILEKIRKVTEVGFQELLLERALEMNEKFLTQFGKLYGPVVVLYVDVPYCATALKYGNR